MLPSAWAFRVDRVEADETEVRRLPQIAAQQVNGLIGRERVGFLAPMTGVPMMAALATPADASMASERDAATAAVPMLSEIMFLPFRVVIVFSRRRKPPGESACVPGGAQYRSTFGSTGRPSAPNRATTMPSGQEPVMWRTNSVAGRGRRRPGPSDGRSLPYGNGVRLSLSAASTPKTSESTWAGVSGTGG